VRDGLPVETSAEGGTIEVRGAGECHLLAEVEGMVVAEHQLTPLPPSAASAGTSIGETPLRFSLQEELPSAPCDKGITDGKCELLVWLIPDADCITDADFSIAHFDSRGPIEDGDYVGRGLTTSVSLGVTVGPDHELLSGKRAPMDVTWSYDERLFGLLGSKEDAHVEIGECLPPGETRLVHVRVDALGPQQIEFKASNINDTAELDFATRGVDEGRVETSVGEEKITEREYLIFAGSSAVVSAHYQRSDGLVLRGDAPLEVFSDNAAGRANVGAKGALFVGEAPAQLQIRPTVGSGGQSLRVVGIEAASSLTASAIPAQIQLGETLCIQVTVHDVDGTPIRGAGDAPLHARLHGATHAWVLDPMTTARSVCLRAVGHDPEELALELGAATLTLPLPAPISR